MKTPITNFDPKERPRYDKAIAESPEFDLEIGPASDFDGTVYPIKTDLCLYWNTSTTRGGLDAFWRRLEFHSVQPEPSQE